MYQYSVCVGENGGYLTTDKWSKLFQTIDKWAKTK